MGRRRRIQNIPLFPGQRTPSRSGERRFRRSSHRDDEILRRRGRPHRSAHQPQIRSLLRRRGHSRPSLRVQGNDAPRPLARRGGGRAGPRTAPAGRVRGREIQPLSLAGGKTNVGRSGGRRDVPEVRGSEGSDRDHVLQGARPALRRHLQPDSEIAGHSHRTGPLRVHGSRREGRQKFRKAAVPCGKEERACQNIRTLSHSRGRLAVPI
mmetsp:Transcript_22518/g.51558  ORF Transcript_22518/g.51558 Transcript_22518/m.51558 type:complete len:209 (+) Transcript_22518:246-872(+)